MRGYSIIIPVKAINDYIHESVPIILQLDYEAYEVIIVPNDEPDRAVLPAYLRHPKVRILASGRVSPAVKRDMAANLANFDTLAFLDDDAYPQADWLRVADQIFGSVKAEALGGPGVTPLNSSLGQKASGLFFETLIGGGGMDYRYKPNGRSFYVDDFPTVNLIVKKAAFEAVGGFDNEFWPGEDTKFCLDFVQAGYKIWYSSDLIVFHHRRDLIRPHLKQVGNYGKHRGYFVKRFPQTSARPTYFAPSCFLLGNVFLLIMGFAWQPAWQIWSGLLVLYFSLALADVALRTRRPILGLLTVVAIFLSHLTYGWMFLRGLLARRNFQSQLR